MDLKQLSKKPERIASGHRACAGCAFPIIVRTVLKGTDKPLIASIATGCLEVTSTIFPYNSWNIPCVHNAFENAAATISGAETAYRALKKKGKIKDDIRFISFGGDGGTYDIGLQSLSGALERGHHFTYVCYDNEAYMNTGIQRSSATPFGANTTTAPAGKVHQGKEEFKKDLVRIAVAHNIPYVAQAAVHNWADLYMKAEKALNADGPAVLVVFSPCIPGWGIKSDMAIEISKMATNSNFWPLFEVENGKYKLNYKPSKTIPVTEYLKPQGRFKHLFKPENAPILEKIQKHVDGEWERLLRECGEDK